VKRATGLILLFLSGYLAGRLFLGVEFQLFTRDLLSLTAWAFGAIAALSYPFFNYTDGIAKDFAPLGEKMLEPNARAVSNALEVLKGEIVRNVLLAFACFVVQTVLLSASDRLGLNADVALGFCFIVMGLSLGTFALQCLGFNKAVELRSRLQQFGNAVSTPDPKA
jgi:hypothetical protein